MSVIETVYPFADVAAGSWLNESGGSVLYASLDETGTDDGDTSYAYLSQGVAGTTTSEFEVRLSSPGTWKAPLVVRDGETWKTVQDAWVRDGETWKRPKVIRVRDGETWKFGVPQLVVRCVAKRVDNLAHDPISGTLKLKVGATIIASTSLSLTDGMYVETSLTIDAADLV